eukprot:TRINITY_DN9563_c0_g1_i1.p1 TRINITY_DN9563_c0_g1~~TRINITY_DN9563_c0_g1_i1.p1  ORF type:complete len:607 (-),score=172.55 TRINITY_DN9563_c0_g1_i1:775-2595(-)
MTSRMRKVTTTSTSFASQSASASGSETPAGTSRRSRSERSPSPVRATRQQEQEDLQGLNDRLANYIDKVRFLEHENSRLSTQVQSTEEIVKREVSSVKTLYESELADARRLLDDTAREKARIQIEANKYKSDYEELLGRFTRRDREASAYQHRVETLEVQLAELNAKLNDADGPRKRLEKENASLRAEIAALKKQVAELKKKLEEETLLRVDLENRLQSLKEELNFTKQVHEQEIEEHSIRTTTKIEEVDGRLEEEYEQRLLEALREIRGQHEEDLQRVRYELETLYETKIADLKAQADRVDTTSNSAWEELRITRKRADEMGSKLARLESENAGFRLRIEDLENQLARERDEFRMRLAQKDGELADLRESLDDQMRDYGDLLNIKIRLDREIEAYRKLLESEEVRLNISLDSSHTSQTSRSASRDTPAGRSTKRRRVDIAEGVEEYSQKSSSSGYARSASAKGNVTISEVDSEGKFIQLSNESRKDIAVGGWQLQHTSGDQETSFKFHRSLVIKPGKTVTVWSTDSGTTHSPPTDVVMKGKRWFVGDEMKTVLIDSEEDEMAECIMSKSSLRSVTSFSQRRSGPRGQQESVEYGEGQDREKCTVM